MGINGADDVEASGVEEHLQIDQKHLWHPYTSMVRPTRVWSVRSADGCTIELQDGRRLVDGMASWWCAIHGYNVPELNAAATKQLDSMSHVMFGGLTHRPATDLAKLLVDCAPPGLTQVFLCDSGSVSVEVALRLACRKNAAIRDFTKKIHNKVLAWIRGFLKQRDLRLIYLFPCKFSMGIPGRCHFSIGPWKDGQRNVA